MDTVTVWLSIGRNVGADLELSEIGWRTFRASEDSFALLVLIDSHQLPALRRELRSLAISHQQEGIGCVVSDGPSVVTAEEQLEQLPVYGADGKVW